MRIQLNCFEVVLLLLSLLSLFWLSLMLMSLPNCFEVVLLLFLLLLSSLFVVVVPNVDVVV